jgi:CheY-like chemotaxis protein
MKKHILWVDDNPDNNSGVRTYFEKEGFAFTLAVSTREALELLSKHAFDAIISDMGRKEGPREGYVLLDKLRSEGNHIPYIICAGSNLMEHKLEVLCHAGQGCTNNSKELLEMLNEVVGKWRPFMPLVTTDKPKPLGVNNGLSLS